MISWVFLAVAALGAVFTLNAYIPQRRTGPLIVPSFLFGWLTTELALHHVAWQMLATAAFVWGGALGDLPGQLGLGVTLLSWLGLIGLVPIARHSEPVVEAALIGALGPGYRDEILPELAQHMAAPPPRTRHVLPFRFANPAVEVTRDIAYCDDDDPRHQLDVYAPRSATRNAPILLQVHGGGWTIGNKREQALPLMTHLAGRGWICVAANYRLSPKATFPDHLIDLKRALQWIRREIGRFGGDPDFVCATGGSAGGHLSALLALTAGDPEYQPGFEEVDTTLRACVPFYGVYDFSNHYRLQAQSMHTFLERTVLKRKLADATEDFRRASPMHRMHSDAPPFYVIHGSNDSLASVEEARHFATSLRRVAKEPVAYAEIPGAQHAFEVFHSVRTTHVVHSVDRFLAWVHSRYLRSHGAGES